jgi:hypothetical protein
VSDVDGANMNRTYPGDPDGGPIPGIPHFVRLEILLYATLPWTFTRLAVVRAISSTLSM